MTGFTHLHCHGAHSFLDGASGIGDLVARAAALGMEALALTDTNGLYGAVPFCLAARAAGVRPIVGAELRDATARLVLLARTPDGYRKLCALITAFHRSGKRLLAAPGGGAGFPARLRALLADGDPDLFALIPACRLLRLLPRGAPPPGLFLETPAAAGAPRIARLARLAARLRLPPVATGPVVFARPERHALHRVLAAVRTRATVGTLPPGALAPPGAWLRSGEEMRRIFSALPAAVENARRIADACRLELPLGRFHPPLLVPAGGESAAERLRRLCREGLARRLRPPSAAARARLRRELEAIGRLGFDAYFLVAHDIVQEAGRRGIPVIGRGSAAGSLVSYCLGITHVDPLAHDLYFERFLNPARRTPPDIDLDLAWNRRDEMLAYVFARHGTDRAAMLSTHVTFTARLAVREIGKALGVPIAEIDRWTRHLPHAPAASIPAAAQTLPECRGLPVDREPLRTVIRLAAAIEGFPRHLGVHAGGIVVAPFPIERVVPLEPAAKGVLVTQCEMRAAEAFGLVKIDLLGQRSLAVLGDALDLIEANRGTRPDVRDAETLFGDAGAASLIREGRTMGCFYIESPGMRQLLKKLDVATYGDLVAASSVIRPGVAESGMLRQYVDRHRGREKAVFLHPGMESILAETHGVMIYQEDVMRVAHLVAGMTMEEADLLRRAMSGRMRSREAMRQTKERFAASAAGRGIPPAAAAEIWRQIESFAGYAFCKAHSASFALLSWQVAFLKAHWPAEFIAAVLSNGGGFYPAQAYLDEARRLGLAVLPPHVNRSGAAFDAGPGWIRAGLGRVKGLRGETIRRITAARTTGGPFVSIEDLVRRAGPDRREAERLILCGACAGLGRSRPEMLRALYLCGGRRRRPVELPLFGDAPAAAAASACRGAGTAASAGPHPPSPAPRVSEYDAPTAHALERGILGAHVTAHPLEAVGAAETPPGFIRAVALDRQAGRRVALVGWLVCTKRVRTSRGGQMRFLTFEDATALFEAVLFPDAYRRFGHLLRSPGPFAVRGLASDDGGAVVLKIDRLEPFPASSPRRTRPGISPPKMLHLAP
ncbi:MAG TPA: DNA polymerase III subunit alpha [bacterium]|nr:DNA polymerase III subunit alpha [Chlamydiota bacterium]HOE26295.1 DNA polymerase III subunit alpha [bacterium]HQM52121.1 DNA polymerase III subunit alpha [bacterium]